MILKNGLWVLIITFLLLLIPFLGHWDWTGSDYVIMGGLLFLTGLTLDFVIRKGGRYRFLAALGILFLFFWLWVELAVGLFTNWGS